MRSQELRGSARRNCYGFEAVVSGVDFVVAQVQSSHNIQLNNLDTIPGFAGT